MSCQHSTAREEHLHVHPGSSAASQHLQVLEIKIATWDRAALHPQPRQLLPITLLPKQADVFQMLSTRWTREQKSRVACLDVSAHLQALSGHDLEVPGAGDQNSGEMDGKMCRFLAGLCLLGEKKGF